MGDLMVWFLVFHIYVAPADAVDWNGPWNLDDKPALTAERYFNSQSECEALAKELISKMHEGMLAPMRYNCVAIPSSLPKGAER
jgi:hypothetical protein